MELRSTSCYLLATVALGIGIFPEIVTAQISSDGSLSTTVSTDDAVNFLIENGDRSGSNLFHSFREFAIPNLGSAYFNNTTDITNIFSRVTGGNISEIQGLIRANGTANLFLINPAGIVFGENASLDVGGSFFATTAESVVFGDGIEFSATQPQEAPLLTINITPGVQFGNNPQPIVVQSQIIDPVSESTVGLQVQPGQTIALVGGNLEFPGGNLTASSGRIELGSVAANSFVNITPLESGWTLNYEGVNGFQDINLTDGAFLDTSGNSGGNVEIQGRRVSVTEGSGILANTFGDESGGILRIRATESIEISFLREAIEEAQFFISRPSFSQLSTRTFGSAKGNDLIVETPDFTLAGFAFISATTIGEGDAGNVSFDVDNFRISDGGQFGAAVINSGNGGNVTITAQTLEIIGFRPNDGSEDISFSGIFVNPQQGSTGDGEIYSLKLDSLRIAEGGLITASTLGAGDGGNVTIRATEIEVSDALVDFSGSLSGLTISVDIGATGNGGNLTVDAESLRVFDGGQVNSSTLGDGAAGDITLRINEIEVSGISEDGQSPSRISAFSETDFPAGSIDITTDNLSVRDGATISVSNTGAADAGNLNINADNIFLDNQGSLQAEVIAGNQGNINLNSQLLLLRNNSNITTNAGNLADGGNIIIDTVNLVALENSDITANAVFGQGGDIFVTAQGLFLSPDSSITASSEFGVDGVITINTPQEDNSAALIQLPNTLTDPSQQIAQGCAWTATSSFYVTGRGGMPEDPTAIISVQDILSDVRSSPNQSSVISHQSPPKQETIVEANAWIINERGNVELVAIVPNNHQNLEQVARSCSGEVGS